MDTNLIKFPKREEEKLITVCVGIPHMGLFHWQTVASLLSVKFPKNTKVAYHMIGSSLVYEARESIARYAIKNNYDYTLFLDSDMVPPNDMIPKMLNIFEQKPECGIVTGMAFKRTPPFQPCFYTGLRYDTKTMKPMLTSPIEFGKEGLIELEGCGMACCMIKTSIFSEIKQPWFYPMPNMGEDLTFCLKVNQKGIKIYVDLSIDVGHVSTMPITSDHFNACYQEHKKMNTGKPLFEEVDV